MPMPKLGVFAGALIYERSPVLSQLVGDDSELSFRKWIKGHPQKPRKSYMGEMKFPRIPKGFEKIPVPKLEFLRVP